MKKLSLIVYAWGSTIIFILFLFWLATVPNLEVGDGGSDELFKVMYRVTLYSLLFILFYRSLVLLLKSTIDRLSKWRSKREKTEDAEFTLVIESLLIIITILATSLIAIVEEFIQSSYEIEGRSGEVKDVLISIMAILLTAIVTYSAPVIGELEVAIKHKITEGLQTKTRKKK